MDAVEQRLTEIERRLSVQEQLMRQLLKVYEGVGFDTREISRHADTLRQRLDIFERTLSRVQGVLEDLKYLVDTHNKSYRALERAADGIAALGAELAHGNKILEEEAAKLSKSTTGRGAVVDDEVR